MYLWVDGSDPVWRAKKAAYEQGGAPVSLEAVNEARFANNDELKYSLRSVERYAPWIRHIYIVTDGQVPAWIDLTNPRVSIIDQAHQPDFRLRVPPGSSAASERTASKHSSPPV